MLFSPSAIKWRGGKRKRASVNYTHAKETYHKPPVAIQHRSTIHPLKGSMTFIRLHSKHAQLPLSYIAGTFTSSQLNNKNLPYKVK